MYLVDNGAKLYIKDFGERGGRIDSMFNRPTRLLVAEKFAREFEREARTGDFRYTEQT